LDGVRIETAKAVQVVELLAEGCGIRAISRLTRLDQGTILNILKTAGIHCIQLLDAKLRNLFVEQVQIDEVYSFVNCLQQNTTVEDGVRGDQYLFLALERTGKLILHWHVGKRDKVNARHFLRGLKPRIVNPFQLTTDGSVAYSGVEGGIRTVFRSGVDYGVEIKHFAADSPSTATGKGKRRENPVRCQWVKRYAEIGNPVHHNITVNHAERTNLSVRLFNKRFARKTICYSKTLENHRHSVALLIAPWNLCRVHSAHKQTPAHAHGLTDHAWTVEELILGAI
jgi:IS1 family transposase